jgi:hypothetical protein
MLLNGPLGWPTFDELKIKVVRWASDRGIPEVDASIDEACRYIDLANERLKD